MEIGRFVKRLLSFGFYILCAGIIVGNLLMGLHPQYRISINGMLLAGISIGTTTILGTYLLCSSYQHIEDKKKSVSTVFRVVFIFYICLLTYILFFDNRLFIIGNLLVLSPMGFFLPCIFNRWMTKKRYVFVMIATILGIEVTQVLLKVGTFEVYEIILWLIGALTAYWVYYLRPVQFLFEKVYLKEKRI